MNKVSKNIKFKPYHRDTSWLLPPSLSELIPQEHPARFIDKAVDELDISEILSSYKPGGTSIYHPRVLIKLLVYGYLDRKYSSRELEKALHENVVYMWLCSMNKPDHVTINNFRKGKLKGEIKNLFMQTVKNLYDKGMISLKTQVVDGTKMESVANRYTHVWAKNIKRFKGNLEQKIDSLLKEVDSHINNEKIAVEAESPKQEEVEEKQSQSKSNEVKARLGQLEQLEDKEIKRKVKKIKNHLLPKLESYEQKEQILNGRNSYSKTDPDATFMRMKDDRLGTGQLKPAYNLQVSSEDQFIVGFSLHQNANDASCYIDHTNEILDLCSKYNLPKFEQANGDSIYGTEQIYEYLEEHKIGNYLKYPSFHADLKNNDKKYPFHTRTLYYNEQQDYYVCPMGQKMHKFEDRQKQRKTGFVANVSMYKAQNCKGCPLQGQCTKAAEQRTITRNHNLEKHKAIARNNLESEQGKQMRSKRSIDVEPIFGHIKYNRFFDRLMLVGIDKIEVEIGLHAMAHNLKKMFKLIQKDIKKGAFRIIQRLSFYYSSHNCDFKIYSKINFAESHVV